MSSSISFILFGLDWDIDDALMVQTVPIDLKYLKRVVTFFCAGTFMILDFK